MPWGVAAAAIGAVGAISASNKSAAAQDRATDANRAQGQIAQDQWDRYKTVYAPLEDQYVANAANYDSPENFMKAAGEASATVSEQFGKARDRLARTPGLDPSSAGYAANLVGLDMNQAAVDATQQNAARNRVKDVAYAHQTDALSLGKGLPAQASSGLASAASGALGLANAQSREANDTAAGLGKLVSNIGDAWNRPRASTSTQQASNNSSFQSDSNGYVEDQPVYA